MERSDLRIARLLDRQHIAGLAPLKAVMLERATPMIPGPLARASAKAFMPRGGQPFGAGDHDIVATKAQIHVPREIDLPEHHGGGDAKTDGDRELQHHQGGTQGARTGIAGGIGAQHRSGTETGDHQAG